MGEPFEAGIALPRGACTDSPRRVLFSSASNAGGGKRAKTPTPLDSRVLLRWPDGSIQWLALRGILPPGRIGPQPATLRILGDDAEHGPSQPRSLRLCQDERGFYCLDDGVHIGIERKDVFLSLRNTNTTVYPWNFTLRWTDSKRTAHNGRIDKIISEWGGSHSSSVRFEGGFGQQNAVRFQGRLTYFSPLRALKLTITLQNPHRALHRGGIWDLGDPNSILFRGLEVLIKPPNQETEIKYILDPNASQPRKADSNSLIIHQESSGGDEWYSPNHFNRERRIPLRYRGYRVRDGSVSFSGLRAQPLLSASSPHEDLHIGIPHFWENFPSSICCDSEGIHLEVFPRHCADLHELQGGEQKTHAFWFMLTPTGVSHSHPLGFVHKPSRIIQPPEWYEKCGVFQYFSQVSAQGTNLSRLLSDALDGPQSFFEKREWIDEYGWRHFGEVYADHEQRYYHGKGRVISHFNNQYDVILGMLLSAARSGDCRWFDLIVPLARHVMDIDRYHTHEDKAAYNGGLFWHTDHYVDAETATHRTFSRYNRKSRTYGGGPASQHNFTTGLFYYHLMTGDPDARLSVKELADWVLRMDDGTLNILSLIDEGPTGWASDTFGFHGPGRGCGYSINALMDAWILIGEDKYKLKAEELIRRSIHPQDDPQDYDMSHAELRWSYTIYLMTLDRYLQLKAQEGELDTMYAYARQSLIRYAQWMLTHERPYFDRIEELEFPTETWAGQEMRKANVLRAAACYADPPLRRAMEKAGHEYSTRAWQDLNRFESRTVARSLAIMMVEGARDEWFRSHPSTVRLKEEHPQHFALRTEFIPQRERVLRHLKNGKALKRAASKLFSFRWWSRTLSRQGSLKP